MGLMLSILVVCVGVLEVLACVRHVQDGYLSCWAPRLRERWRKKPSEDEHNNCHGGAGEKRDCCPPALVENDVNLNHSSSDHLLFKDIGDVGDKVRQVHNIYKTKRPDKMKPNPISIRDDQLAEDFTSPHLSSSPKRCCTPDICWPTFSPHSPVSKRPSIDPICSDLSPQCAEDLEVSAILEQTISAHPLLIEIDETNSTVATLPKRGAQEWPIRDSMLVENELEHDPKALVQADDLGDLLPSTTNEMEVSTLKIQDEMTCDSDCSIKEADDVNYPVEIKPHEGLTRREQPPPREFEVETSNVIEDGEDGSIIAHTVEPKDPQVPKPEDTGESSLEVASSKGACGEDQKALSDTCCRQDQVATLSSLSAAVLQDGSSLEKHSHDTQHPIIPTQKPHADEETSQDSNTLEGSSPDSTVVIPLSKQTRRSSKTEILPHDESVAVTSLTSEEATFATEKTERRRHHKPAKAASFEEARLDSFRTTKPTHLEINPGDGRRSVDRVLVGLSVTDRSDVDQSSAVVGRIEVKQRKDSSGVLGNDAQATQDTTIELQSFPKETDGKLEASEESPDVGEDDSANVAPPDGKKLVEPILGPSTNLNVEESNESVTTKVRGTNSEEEVAKQTPGEVIMDERGSEETKPAELNLQQDSARGEKNPDVGPTAIPISAESPGEKQTTAGEKQTTDVGTSQQVPPGAFWLIFSGEYTKAMSKDWHSGHFCCWQCDESLTGQRYVLRDDHPYCIKCYESVFANVCEECNKTIGIDSKDLSYKDKHWHEACFLCTKCRVSLVDKQFGSKADKIYCGNCYDAQFASRCDGCGEIFRAGTKKMEYKTRQWHEKCFCCCVCKSAIGTKSFIPREQEIYCATCYEEKFATRCVKCNKIITSGGVTYKNEPWHRECFTCTHCNTSLAGQRFTSRDEKPYCADCFGELFAKRCTACVKPITGIGGTRFISFEDRHWHNDCFICATCKTSLVGKGFITDADDIICPDCAKQKLM